MVTLCRYVIIAAGSFDDSDVCVEEALDGEEYCDFHQYWMYGPADESDV